MLRHKYDMAKDLDVRKYVTKLGGEINKINMSKLNRTLFGARPDEAGAVSAVEEESAGSHFNITQSALIHLTRVGLDKEVVRQGDSTE